MPIAVTNNLPGTGPTLVQYGNVTFYKYEPFNYTFTNSGYILSLSGQNLLSYFSGSGTSTITFKADNGFASTNSQSGDIFTITSEGAVFTFKVFVLSGRFTGPSTIVAYIGESLTINYPSITTITSAFWTPTLPSGLTYSNSPSNVLVTGTITSLFSTTNYLLYGSNSTNGYTVSQLVSIQTCNARVIVTPAAPPIQDLKVGTLFSGLTLTNALSGSLSFTGSLPPGLYFTPTSGTSTTITGTPTSNSVSTFTALCTARNAANTAFTIVTIPFQYEESVEFVASTRLSWQLWSNISISNTYGSNIQLTAVTEYGNDSGMTYTSPGFTSATGLGLSTSGEISGAATTGGPFVFTATNGNATIGYSPTIAFNLSQASFTTSSVPSSVSGYVGKAISPFTFTLSTPAYSTFPATSRTITGIPSGLVVTGSNQTFTLSGIPNIEVTTTATILVTASNVTPLTISIPFTISPDVFTFTPTSQTFIFAQNIPITPIQFTATPTYGIAVTLYSSTSLPVGLNITSTGLVRGSPLVSGSGTFTITATNGYSSIESPSYSYSTAQDTMLCYSSSGSSFSLAPTSNVNIPIITLLRSGVSVSGLRPGYLYGLRLTPTLLSGFLRSCVYPDVVLPASSTITINGSNANGDVSSTFFTLTASNVQASTNPNIIVGGQIKYFSNGANRNPDTNPATTENAIVTDFQSATPGGPEFMIVGNNITLYSPDGGVTYSEYDPPHMYSVAALPALPTADPPIPPTWYGVNDSLNIQYWDYESNVWQPGSTSPAPMSARADGGLILRATQIPAAGQFVDLALSATSDGNTITYVSTNGASLGGPGSGPRTLSFAGFSNPEFNLEGVIGSWYPAESGEPQTIEVTSRNAAAGSTSTGGKVTVMNVVPTRLLLGGTSLAYCYPDDYTWSTSIPPSKALQEIRDISTNVPSMIIVAGGYAAGSPSTTLQYSTDYGVTLNTSTNDFTLYATNVVWGGYRNQDTGTTRVWIALGRNINNIPAVKFSTNGMTWADIVGVGGTYTSSTLLGPLQFDGTNWNLLVDNYAWTHDAAPDTLAAINQWTRRPAMDNITFFCPTPYFITPATPTGITLNIGITGSGPAFSSPTITSYLGYQYVPISTITFDTATGDASFFLASTLPAGLAWSTAVLNANGHVCATITGRPVILGTSSIDVYAQNTAGISKITITLITQRIPFKTPNTTPSGYINFIKQKVIADSAVSSINNRALVSPVGTFLAKDPQPEITAPEICCLKPSTQ
jgi:hypothetical protein